MRRPVGKTTVWRRQELVRLGVLLFDWHTLVLHCPPLWLTYPGVTLPSIMTDVPWCYSAPPLWLMYPCVKLPSLVTIWHTLQLHCPPSRLPDTPWRYTAFYCNWHTLQLHCPPSRLPDTPWRYTAFHCNWHTLQLHCPPLSPYDTPWRYTALHCDFFLHTLALHCPLLWTHTTHLGVTLPCTATNLLSSGSHLSTISCEHIS